jgi:uncharacterized OsmC-like protein
MMVIAEPERIEFVSANDIRQAIEAATGYLSQHPDDARSTDSAATASLVDGLVVRVTGPDGASVTTDMVPSVGGTATAPSPGWLLRAAVASCVATLIAMRAATLEITLDALEVVVDSVSDDRGILGIDDAVPAGPLSARIAIRIVGAQADPASLDEIANWAVIHCPVSESLERSIPLSIDVTTA